MLEINWTGERCWVGGTQVDVVERCPCYLPDFCECYHPDITKSKGAELHDLDGKRLSTDENPHFDGTPPDWCPLRIQDKDDEE